MVDDAPPLTRSAKLATIGAILPHADKLLSEPEMLRAGKPSDAFRKELSATIVSQVAFAPSWVGAFDMSGSRVALAENIQVLRALGQRVRTSRATTLNDGDREVLGLRSRFFVWGDFLADVATGNRVNGFHPNDVQRFVSTLPAALTAARAVVGSGESIDATFALVEDRVDVDAFSRGDAESWRAAWGLITVAYLLADKIGDPLHLYAYRITSFPTLRRIKRDLAHDVVECPECGAQRELDEGLPTRAFEAAQWRCDECALAGYFPMSVPRGTVWDDEDERPVPTFASAEESFDPLAGETTFFVDLSWMADAKLRAIAEEDFADVGRCITAGANKPALFSAGSACEGMLLDVLQRNEPLTRSQLKKPQDWPDRVSLDTMIEIGMAERFLTDTHGAAADAVRKHRDLVHPNRMVASRITVDGLTARMLAHAALAIARDLKNADDDGRLTAFATKQIGG